MKDEIKRQLDAAFAQHAQKLNEEQQTKVARETKEQQFLKDFRERRTLTIRPTFEHISEYLHSKGMETRIGQSEETVGRNGKLDAHEEISFVLCVGDEGRLHHGFEQPHLTLRPNKHNWLVDIYESTLVPGRGGHSGGIGSVKLEEITQAFLEEKVRELVIEVL